MAMSVKVMSHQKVWALKEAVGCLCTLYRDTTTHPTRPPPYWWRVLSRNHRTRPVDFKRMGHKVTLKRMRLWGKNENDFCQLFCSKTTGRQGACKGR